MKKEVIVKKSKINGKGLFAERDFKKGEVIIKWNPQMISKKDAECLTEKDRSYVYLSGRKYYLMQVPERYVNYSYMPNSFVGKFCDIAKRDIVKGEEITTNFEKENIDNFKCNCGSQNCKK